MLSQARRPYNSLPVLTRVADLAVFRVQSHCPHGESHAFSQVHNPALDELDKSVTLHVQCVRVGFVQLLPLQVLVSGRYS